MHRAEAALAGELDEAGYRVGQHDRPW